MCKTYEYHLFGFKLLTDFEFRQLVPFIEDGSEYPVITIFAGTVSDEIKAITNKKWEFGSRMSWLTNDSVWIVVEDGCKMTYERKPDNGSEYYVSNPNAYLMGWGMAMIALQRGILAMHCSVVADDTGAILISGESGAGKSTVTNGLLEQGYSFLADDMAFVDSQSGPQTIVYSAFPYQKLCRNVCEEKNLDFDKLIYIDEMKDKFLVPYEGKFELKPMPVKGFIMLGVRNSIEDVQLYEMEGLDSFQVLINNLFMRHLLGKDKYKPEIGAACMKMASNVKVACILRPRDKNTADEVVNTALKLVQKW